MVLGLVALAGATAVFYADLPWVVAGEATAVGGLGIVAAIIGVARVRPVSAAAVFGVVAAGLAVVLGLTGVVVEVTSARDQLRRPTRDTATVLDKQLHVTLGTFEYTGNDSSNLPQTQLSVTVRNRLPVARWFRIVIAAYDGDRHQVLSASPQTLLAADATATLDAFGFVTDTKIAERLTRSTFRIIAASSDPVM